MKKKMTTKKKILVVVFAVIIALFCYGVYYLTSYLPANDFAKSALVSSEKVHVTETKDTIVFTPTDVTPTTALIYYPGGKVEPSSFAFAAAEISSQGYLVIIQKMPFNLAILGVNEADKIIESYPNIENWYISGFSLGGTAASMYAKKHVDQFDGLILYASYTTSEFSLNDTSLNVLSISGTNDGLATPNKIKSEAKYLPASTHFIFIEGANHTQMALYNNAKPQDGDNPATITDIQQQQDIIDATLKFMKK